MVRLREVESVYSHGVTGLWDLAKTEYPADNLSHFFYLIGYMIAFYGLVHLICHFLFKACIARYEKMNRHKQGEYRGNAISPIHSLACVYFATSAAFYVCGPGVSAFNNEQCFNTPRYLHIWALVHSCGYFAMDTAQICILSREFTTIDKQMIGHHVIATLTFLGTLAFMNWTVVFGVLLLFVEVSTTYICVRWLLYTHKMHKTVCHTINAAVVFITFLLGRLVYQLGLLFGYGFPNLVDMFQDEKLHWFKVCIIIFMFIALTVSAMMNIWWMYLIVAQIRRIINRPAGDFQDEISASDMQSQAEADGAEPSLHGESMDDRTPLLFGRESQLFEQRERVDTDEERDDLHISST